LKKTIVAAALIITIAIFAAPFFYNGVQSYQKEQETKELRNRIESSRQRTMVLNATVELSAAAHSYKDEHGSCPANLEALPSKYIDAFVRRESKPFIKHATTDGNCTFQIQ